MLKFIARMILAGVLVASALPVVSLILPGATSVAFAEDVKPCAKC